MPGDTPQSTWIYRIIHVDSLDTCLRRKGLHASNCVPDDELPYRSIHRTDIQQGRMSRPVPCGPGGTLCDYVPFYFGPRSVMLLQLRTGRVPGYSEGQEPIIYLVSSVQRVVEAGVGWVFTDGHGLMALTSWYDDLDSLDEVDWKLVHEDYWADTPEDNDRQRRKQAEFLVHEFCSWNLIRGIGVFSSRAEARVKDIMSAHPKDLRRKVKVMEHWYY